MLDPKWKKRGGAYLPFNWRGWLDFGGGALADMACHTMDSIFMSLDPGFPTHVEAINVDTLTDDAFPKGSTLKWTFGPKGDRPGFDVYWYDGTDNEYTDKDGKTRRHPRLEELAEGAKLTTSGNIYVGTKHKLLSHRRLRRLLPHHPRRRPPGVRPGELKDSDRRPPPGARHGEVHRPPHRVARGRRSATSPTTTPARTSSTPARSPRPSSSATSACASRARSLAWDGPNLRFSNNEAANQLITKTYRASYDFKLEKV